MLLHDRFNLKVVTSTCDLNQDRTAQTKNPLGVPELGSSQQDLIWTKRDSPDNDEQMPEGSMRDFVEQNYVIQLLTAGTVALPWGYQTDNKLG